MRNKQKEVSREKLLVFWLILIALVIRLISLATFRFIDSGGGSDSVAYLVLAKNLFSGHGYTQFGIPHTAHPPFYPVLIGVLWKMGFDLLLAGQMVSVFAGAALVVPAYFLGRFLFSKRVAFWSGLFVALFPVLVYGSTEAFSESLYAFLFLSAIAVFWRGFQQKKVILLFPSGILLGLAFLAHPSGLAFAALLPFFLLLSQFSSWRLNWGKFVLGIVVLMLGFSLACLPFWIYLHRVTGEWQLSGSSHYMDISLRAAQARGVPEQEIIFQHMEMLFHPSSYPPTERGMGVVGFAFLHPGQFFQVIKFNIADGYLELQKTARFLGLPSWVLLLGLATGGIILLFMFFLSLIKRRITIQAWFLILLFLSSLVFILVTIEHRYFYAYIPLLLIVLARGLDGWQQRVESSTKAGKRVAFYLLLWGLILAMAAGSAGVIYRKWRKIGNPYEYKFMGEWMKKEIPGIENEKVMMVKLGVSYYAGCQWNVFYWGDYKGLVEYLQKRKIKYVLLDDYTINRVPPDLRFLLEAEPPPPEFQPVKNLRYRGRRVRLLEFLPGENFK